MQLEKEKNVSYVREAFPTKREIDFSSQICYVFRWIGTLNAKT